MQPQQSPGWRQPGPHRREWQAQAFAQAGPSPQPGPQRLLLDLPFHHLCDDAVQDVGDAVVLRGGRGGGQEGSGSPGPPGRARPASVARPPAHHSHPPPHPQSLLTLGRAGVTGAKAICIRSCPKQSLTAVEASSSQREGQGRGPRPARSSAGVSVESGVSAKENNSEGFTFLWRLHCPHALPSAPGRAC